MISHSHLHSTHVTREPVAYRFTDTLLTIAWLLHVEHQTKLQEQAYEYVVKFHS